MNTAEGVRRLAQVIRGASTVLAAVWVVAVLAVSWPDLFKALVFCGLGGAVIVGVGHSVAWVLMGFAGDRSPPREPGDR